MLLWMTLVGLESLDSLDLLTEIDTLRELTLEQLPTVRNMPDLSAQEGLALTMREGVMVDVHEWEQRGRKRILP